MAEPSLKPAHENEWYWLYKLGAEYWNEWSTCDNLQKVVGIGAYAETYSERLNTKIKNKFGQDGLFNEDYVIPSNAKEVRFDYLEWKEAVNFDGYIFPTEAHFENSKFNANASFQNCEFRERAIFRNSIFSGTAFFKKANFRHQALFEKTQFNRASSFAECQFNEYADFANLNNKIMHTENPIIFESCTFSGVANYKGANFLDRLTFENSTFALSLNLEAKNFAKLPILTACEIKGDLAIKFEKLKHIQPENGKIHRWAKLRREMNRMHMHHEELDYFAKELDCRAFEEKDFLRRQVYQFYKHSCDYGRSIERPIYGLVSVFLVFLSVYYMFPSNSLEEAASYSLKSTFPFVSADKIVHSDFPSFALQAIKSLQTIVSLIFLFLLGLSVRNRLRIK